MSSQRAGTTRFKQVRYELLVAPLIEAVRELDEKNKELDARLAALEQAVKTNGGPVHLSDLHLSVSWPLLGGFLLVGPQPLI